AEDDGMSPQLAAERPCDGRRTVAAVDSEPEGRGGAVVWEGLSPQACDQHREQRPGGCLNRSSGGAAGELGGPRGQRQRPDRAEKRPGEEREVPAWVAPGHRGPGDAEGPEEEGEPERDVPEREEADREREGECGSGERESRGRGGDRQPERKAGGVE